ARSREPAAPAPQGYPTYPGHGAPGAGYGRARVTYPSQPARRGGAGTLVGVLLALLVLCGGGGLAVTAGISYGYGWITSNEPVTEVFHGEATGGGAGLSVTVTDVWVTSHFTKVAVRADNQTGSSVSLPVFGYCVFSGADGRALEADPTRTRFAKDGWSETLPSGVPHRGVIVFAGHLSPGGATLSFTTVFGQGGGPSSVVVRGITLSPV
ncbi:MAG: hypothetical protein ACRDT4_19660, partial [Micromonosporaceae bacterium]